MTTSYKLNLSTITGEPCSVTKSDLLNNRVECIPFAEGNTDYQQYLAWLAEGNEPLPADGPPTE